MLSKNSMHTSAIIRNESSIQNNSPNMQDLRESQHGKEKDEKEIASKEKACNCQEQVLALLQAVQLLSEFADGNRTAAAQRLDALESKWKLEDTSIPTLRQKMSRLQSLCSALQQDADRHVEDTTELQHQLQSSKNRVTELETAVRKLYQRNERLQLKLKKSKRERISIIKQVKSYVEHVSTTNEQQVATQLKAHERLLQIGAGSNNRSRCNSREMSGFEDDTSFEESASVGGSSVSSSIFDDGIATIRYDSASLEVGSPLKETAACEAQKEYALEFPQGTKIGLQFCEIKVKNGLLNEDLSTTAPQKESPSFMKQKLDSFRAKHQPCGNVYLVCGYYGFDHDLNTPPPVGSRLVMVNEKAVSSMDKVKEAIKSHECEFVSMTFSREPLSPFHDEILQSAVADTTRQNHDATIKPEGTPHTDKQPHPVIIDLHDNEDDDDAEKTTNPLSKFLRSARIKMDFDHSADTVNEPSGEDTAEGETQDCATPGSRLSSFLRSRIDSDPNVATAEGHPVSEGPTDSAHHAGKRLGAIIHGSRMRTRSEPNVMSTSAERAASKERTSSEDIKHDNPATRFVLLFHGSKGRMDSGPTVAAPEGSACDGLGESVAPKDLMPGTPPVDKLKKSMQSVGNTFKSLF